MFLGRGAVFGGVGQKRLGYRSGAFHSVLSWQSVHFSELWSVDFQIKGTMKENGSEGTEPLLKKRRKTPLTTTPTKTPTKVIVDDVYKVNDLNNFTSARQINFGPTSQISLGSLGSLNKNKVFTDAAVCIVSFQLDALFSNFI